MVVVVLRLTSKSRLEWSDSSVSMVTERYEVPGSVRSSLVGFGKGDAPPPLACSKLLCAEGSACEYWCGTGER